MQISEMQRKIQKNFFDFEIISLELVALDTRFAAREHFSSGVHMLTNSLKISDTTKTESLLLIFILNDQKI